MCDDMGADAEMKRLAYQRGYKEGKADALKDAEIKHLKKCLRLKPTER